MSKNKLSGKTIAVRVLCLVLALLMISGVVTYLFYFIPGLL